MQSGTHVASSVMRAMMASMDQDMVQQQQQVEGLVMNQRMKTGHLFRGYECGIMILGKAQCESSGRRSILRFGIAILGAGGLSQFCVLIGAFRLRFCELRFWALRFWGLRFCEGRAQISGATWKQRFCMIGCSQGSPPPAAVACCCDGMPEATMHPCLQNCDCVRVRLRLAAGQTRFTILGPLRIGSCGGGAPSHHQHCTRTTAVTNALQPNRRHVVSIPASIQHVR